MGEEEEEIEVFGEYGNNKLMISIAKTEEVSALWEKIASELEGTSVEDKDGDVLTDNPSADFFKELLYVEDEDGDDSYEPPRTYLHHASPLDYYEDVESGIKISKIFVEGVQFPPLL